MNSLSPKHGFFDWLSTPAGVAIFWLAFGLAFTLLQMHFSPGLQPDDAEVAEAMQRQLRLAYEVRNPPFYVWLLWGVQQLTFEGALAHRLLRYGLMAAIGLLTYAAMRQAKAGQVLATAASLSLLLFSWFNWDFHYRVTHTLPMIVAGLASWLLAQRMRERPSFLLALGLGLSFGIGEISKWSFALFAAGLISALLCDEKGRRALLHPRALLVAVGAAVPLVPAAIGIAQLQGDVLAMTRENLVADQLPHLMRALQGLGLLLVHSFLYQLPWLIFLAVIAWRTRAADGAPQGDTGIMHLAFLTTAIAFGLAALGIVVFGATHINARYLFPVFLVLPLGVFLWLQPFVAIKAFSRGVMAASLVVAAIVLLVRIGSAVLPIDRAGPEYSALIPYPKLAEQLAAQGLGKARFVSDSFRDAANLLTFLPQAEAASTSTNRLALAFSDGNRRDCVIIWRAGRLSGDIAAIDKTVPAGLARIADLKPEEIEPVVVPWPRRYFADSPPAVWLIGRGAGAEAACRAVFSP